LLPAALREAQSASILSNSEADFEVFLRGDTLQQLGEIVN